MNISTIEIDHKQYEKISDDILFLGKNVVMRFNTTLAKEYNGDRNSYHKEFQYHSNKYNEDLITIRRSFDFYVSIENIHKDDITGIKEFIRIGVSEILILQNYIKETLRWFNDKKYENLYRRKEDKLIMIGRVDSIKLSNLPMDKYLEFEPVVCIYEKNTYPGIRMYLSSDSNYVEMSVDKLTGFYYLLTTINMYQSSQLQINYLQRPDYGTNMILFNNEYDDKESIEGVKAKEGRQIKPKRSESIFDQ